MAQPPSKASPSPSESVVTVSVGVSVLPMTLFTRRTAPGVAKPTELPVITSVSASSEPETVAVEVFSSARRPKRGSPPSTLIGMPSQMEQSPMRVLCAAVAEYAFATVAPNDDVKEISPAVSRPLVGPPRNEPEVLRTFAPGSIIRMTPLSCVPIKPETRTVSESPALSPTSKLASPPAPRTSSEPLMRSVSVGVPSLVKRTVPVTAMEGQVIGVAANWVGTAMSAPVNSTVSAATVPTASQAPPRRRIRTSTSEASPMKAPSTAIVEFDPAISEPLVTVRSPRTAIVSSRTDEPSE